MKWQLLILVVLLVSLVSPVVYSIPIKIPTIADGGGGYIPVDYYVPFTFYVPSTITINQVSVVTFTGAQLYNNFTFKGQTTPTVQTSSGNLILMGASPYLYENATLNKLYTKPAVFAYNVTFNLTAVTSGAGMIAISQNEYGLDSVYGLTNLAGNGFIVAIFKGSMQYEYIQVYNGTTLLTNVSTGLTTLSGLVTLGVEYTTRTVNGVTYPALIIYFNGRIVATPILTNAPNINVPITIVAQNNGPAYGYAQKAIVSISYKTQTVTQQTVYNRYVVNVVFEAPAGAVNIAGYNWTYTLVGSWFTLKQISGSAKVVTVSTDSNSVSNYSIVAKMNLGRPSLTPLASLFINTTTPGIDIGFTGVYPESQLNQWGLLVKINITATYSGVTNWSILTLPVQFIGWQYGMDVIPPPYSVIVAGQTVTFTNTTYKNVLSLGYYPLPNPNIKCVVYLNGTMLTTKNQYGVTVPVTLPYSFTAPNVTTVVKYVFTFKLYEYDTYVGSVAFTLTIFPKAGAPVIRVIAPTSAPYLSNFNIAVSLNTLLPISNMTLTANKVYYAQILSNISYILLPITNKYGGLMLKTLGATYIVPFNLSQIGTINAITLVQKPPYATVIYFNNTGATYAIGTTDIVGIGLYNYSSWVQFIQIGVSTGSVSVSASVLIGQTNSTLQFYKAIQLTSNVTYVTVPMMYPRGEYVAVAGGGTTTIVYVSAFNVSNIKPPSVQGLNTTKPPQPSLTTQLYQFNTPYATIIGIIVLAVSVLLFWKFAGVYGALAGLALASFAIGYLGLLPYAVYYVIIFIIGIIGAKVLASLIGVGQRDDSA